MPPGDVGIERLELARQLTLAVQQLDKIWLRPAADRLGREGVLKVYGFNAERE